MIYGRSVRNHRMTDLLESFAGELGVFGASAGVKRAGAPPVLSVWGVDGRNPSSDMTVGRTFRIASVTKTFTSALVLDLVDRGALTLDSTIERWVPSYPHAAQITIRALLDHTAGTADMIFDAKSEYFALLLADLDRRFTPTELVDLMASIPPYAKPGDTYRYSNTDYNLLGRILECITGVDFATLVVRKIATPLALRKTSYDDRVTDDLLHGWFDLEAIGSAGPSSPREFDVRDFPNAALISTAYAAGGMTSTLTDLLAWAESLYLDDWLSPSMRNVLLGSTAVADVDGVGHGLGVVGYGEQSADGAWAAYGHTGNIVGSSSFIAAFPRLGTTVALHANVQEVPPDRLVELACALVELGGGDE